MKFFRSNNNRAIASLFMVLLIGTVLTNRALYVHSHVLTNGQVITHAHPYNKTQDKAPVKSHKHSEIELLSIQQHDVLVRGSAHSTTAIIFVAISLYRQTLSTSRPNIFITPQKGRAPPLAA